MECDVLPLSAATAANTTTNSTSANTSAHGATSSCPIEQDPIGNLEPGDSVHHLLPHDEDVEEPTGRFTFANAQMIPAAADDLDAGAATSSCGIPATTAKCANATSTVAPTIVTRRKPANKPINTAPSGVGSTSSSAPTTSTSAGKARKNHANYASRTQPSATATITQASTMREVLASIPGFSLKPRRRTGKKMSTAAQIAQTREGCIDLETPDSILCGANLRALLNKHTFAMLPPLFQYKLVQLLPAVDRPPPLPPSALQLSTDSTTTLTSDAETPTIRLAASSLNNEFFSRACLEWRERLSEGEFTPENQMKMRTDAEKEKSRLDPWKLKHFEPIWGRDRLGKERQLLAEQGAEPTTTMAAQTKNETHQENGPSPFAESTPTAPGDATTTMSSSSPPTAPKQSPRTVRALTRSSNVAAAASQQNNIIAPAQTASTSANITIDARSSGSTEATTSNNPITNLSASVISAHAAIMTSNVISSPSKTPVPELLPIRAAKTALPTPRPMSTALPLATASVVYAVKPPPSTPSHMNTAADIIVISDSGDDQSPNTNKVITTTSSPSAELTVTISSSSGGISSNRCRTTTPSFAPQLSNLMTIPTTTASYTIPSGIEVIPLDGNNTTISGAAAQSKRHAIKRSTQSSPDLRNQIKISKYNHHPHQLEHHSAAKAGSHKQPGSNNGIGPNAGAAAASSVAATGTSVSDVIQIIKLPESANTLVAQSPLGIAEAPVPSISVAVTTISVATAQAQASASHRGAVHQQQPHQKRGAVSAHLPKRTAAMQIIDTGIRCKSTPTMPLATHLQRTNVLHTDSTNHGGNSSKTLSLLPQPSAASVVHLQRQRISGKQIAVVAAAKTADEPIESTTTTAAARSEPPVDEPLASMTSTTTMECVTRTTPPLKLSDASVVPADDDGSCSGAGFAESPADHVFRAMVCRGDDVLCGDGRLIVQSPAPQQQQQFAPALSDRSPGSCVEIDADHFADNCGANAPMFQQQQEAAAGTLYEFEIGGSVIANEGSNEEGPAAAMGGGDVVEDLEPSIQVLDPMVSELDPIEQEFTDAENYVLESGEISADSSAFERANHHIIGDTASAATAATSSTSVPTATEQPHHNHHHHNHQQLATPAPVIIPMQETLEVRLKESTFPLQHRNWPYNSMTQQQQPQQHHLHIAQQQQQQSHLNSSHQRINQQQPFTLTIANDVATATEGATAVVSQFGTAADAAATVGSFTDSSASSIGGSTTMSQRSVDNNGEEGAMVIDPNRSSMLILSQPNYESTSQVKLELEVTLTPESEVTSSTIAAHHNYQHPHNSAFHMDGSIGADSDTPGEQQRMQSVPPAGSALNATTHMPTIIPPTTIVCLANPMPGGGGAPTDATSTSTRTPLNITYMNAMMHHGGGKPNSVTMLAMPQHHQHGPSYSSSSSSSSSSASSSPAPVFTNNHVQRPPVSLSLPPPASVGSPQSSAATAAGAGASSSSPSSAAAAAMSSVSQPNVWPSQSMLQQQQLQHTHTNSNIASSSSLPYLSLATTQHMRIIAQSAPMRTKASPSMLQQQQSSAATTTSARSISGGGSNSNSNSGSNSSGGSGRGNRGGSNRPPPGAVNLERSYQICQAVIQNSPNRHQLKAQLRPPPSMLSVPAAPPAQQQVPSGGSGASVQRKDDPAAVVAGAAMPVKSSSIIAGQKRTHIVHRQIPNVAHLNHQQLPAVRHVFTTNHGIPVSMTVLPPGMPAHHPMHPDQCNQKQVTISKQQQEMHLHQQQQQQQQPQVIYAMASSDSAIQHQLQQMNHQHNSHQIHGPGDVGQYILVQNNSGANVGMLAHQGFQTQRSSSAPPAQNAPARVTQSSTSLPATSTPVVANGGGLMHLSRPASVDMDGAGCIENMDTSDRHYQPQQQQHTYLEPSNNSFGLQTQAKPMRLLGSNHSKANFNQSGADNNAHDVVEGAAEPPNHAPAAYTASPVSGQTSHHPENHLYATSANPTAPATLARAQVMRMDVSDGGGNTGSQTPPSNCCSTCSTNPMVMCQQCGIFVHDECTGSTKLCQTCVSR